MPSASDVFKLAALISKLVDLISTGVLLFAEVNCELTTWLTKLTTLSIWVLEFPVWFWVATMSIILLRVFTSIPGGAVPLESLSSRVKVLFTVSSLFISDTDVICTRVWATFSVSLEEVKLTLVNWSNIWEFCSAALSELAFVKLQLDPQKPVMQLHVLVEEQVPLFRQSDELVQADEVALEE